MKNREEKDQISSREMGKGLITPGGGR